MVDHACRRRDAGSLPQPATNRAQPRQPTPRQMSADTEYTGRASLDIGASAKPTVAATLLVGATGRYGYTGHRHSDPRRCWHNVGRASAHVPGNRTNTKHLGV